MFLTEKDLELTIDLAKAYQKQATDAHERSSYEALICRAGTALNDLVALRKYGDSGNQTCVHCGEADRTKGDHGKRRGECSPF